MADKKRWVLQLCHSYGAPFDDVARQWQVLFDDSEYRVLTVFLTGKPSDKVSELVGGEVKYLGYKSKDLKGLKRKQIQDIRKLHDEFDFKFAIAHRYKPIYIATHLKNLPVFGVAHAYGVFDGFWRRQYVNRQSNKLTIFGVSNAIRDDVRKSLPEFPEEKIQTFYNRINVEKYLAGHFDKQAAREFLKLPQDAFVIGNVGRLHPDKDQETLINGFAKAVQELERPLLVIIGEGRLEEQLKAQVKSLNLEEYVVFLGRVPDAWKYFKAFDLFALTSNYEPFGMVLLEAMIADVPVISTNVGGAPEVVENQELLFPLSESDALAKLLIDKEILQIGDCRERVESLFSDESAKSNFNRLGV